MHRPTILLADDHPIVREHLVSLLTEADFDVVAAVGDGHHLMESARQLHPDVIVTDLSMPGLNGLDALASLKAERPDSKVIVLTMHADPELAARAMSAGASGYLLKHKAGEELAGAIRQVLQNGVYLTPSLGQDVQRMARPRGADRPDLTPREREVLRLILDGRRTEEIAAALNLSTRTVEADRNDMMEALGVHSISELVEYAIAHRLLMD